METVLSADEIDISNKQSLQLVLNFLEKHFPHSFHLWQFLKNIQHDLITKDCLWPHQLFVNDQHQIKCVIFIYLTVGFNANYQLLSDEESATTRRVILFCDDKDDHLLIPLIQQYISQSKMSKIAFCGIPHRFSSIIGNVISDNNLGKYRVHSFQQLELDKEAFEKNRKQITSSFSSDIVIRPLSVSDAPIVNDHWEYKSPFSLYQLTYEIEHFPAYGAYRDENLISWCLTKFDGSIGTVFTKPEARKLGLATILNMSVASKIFEKEERAYCFVASDNTASLKVFEKLGYHRTCDTDWLIFTLE